MEANQRSFYPSVHGIYAYHNDDDLPIVEEPYNPPLPSYDRVSETKDAYELTKTSTFCFCHAFAVLYLVLSFMSYCFKYFIYSLDWEVYSVFSLMRKGTTYDNRDGRIALFIIQGITIGTLFVSIISNRRWLLYPIRIYQTLLILFQVMCVATYTGYAIVGDLGENERLAVLYLKGYESKYMNEVINKGPVAICITIALTQIVFLLVNLFIMAILDSFNSYLKLRTEYYKVINEQNIII